MRQIWHNISLLNRSIWNQDCIESKSFAPEGHIGCVYSPDLLNLILQLHSSKSYELPLVITAFEDPTFSFGKFIVEAITNLNGDQAKNTSTVTTDLAKLINNQNHDLSKSLLGRHYIPLPGIDHIGNNFESLWESFINENGLNPVNVLVTGPPRARKSEIAKDVAER